jgi:hypothetical protein
MTDPLLDLAGRVEQAKGPDLLLDANIHWQVAREDFSADDDYRKKSYCYARGGWTLNKADRHHLRLVGVPAYTASLDAAMSLVPEGWRWMTGHREHPHARAYVENGEPSFVGVGTRRNPARQWFEVTASTPALALTAACLRAHAAQRGID